MTMEKPIYDPPIPYSGPIYGGRFAPGKMVRIQGIAPGVAYRFDINLQCGPETTPRDDIAIQVSVRLLDGCIVLNSLQNGVWDEEQRGATLPIKRAEKFEIILMSDFNQYKVAINGQHYCEFPQRIHYDRISHLTIDGDVSIIQISYESTSEGGGVGAVSGSGFGVTTSSAPLRASPFPVASSATETDDFELIDNNSTTVPPPLGLNPVPNIGFSQPPSYDAVINNQGGAPYPTKATPYTSDGAAPYHTGGAPYPTVGAPYPAAGAPYPTGTSGIGPGVSPYPRPPLNTPYPTGLPGVVSGSPYPPPGAPGIHPPPIGAPVPLNAVSSNFRPVKRSGTKKCCATFCGILVGILIVVVVVLSKINKTVHRHHHRSHSTSYNSNSNTYGSNYGNSYNSYGSGYDSYSNRNCEMEPKDESYNL